MTHQLVHKFPDCATCTNRFGYDINLCAFVCDWDVESKRYPSGHVRDSEVPVAQAQPVEAVTPHAYQVGGDHYTAFPIQPVEFIQKNGLSFLQGNVVKYVVRKKGDKLKRIEDLRKAIHCIELLIEEQQAA